MSISWFVAPPPQVNYDDNNPFSEGFQERERRERLREQQERQRVQLLQEVRHPIVVMVTRPGRGSPAALCVRSGGASAGPAAENGAGAAGSLRGPRGHWACSGPISRPSCWSCWSCWSSAWSCPGSSRRKSVSDAVLRFGATAGLSADGSGFQASSTEPEPGWFPARRCPPGLPRRSPEPWSSSQAQDNRGAQHGPP